MLSHQTFVTFPSLSYLLTLCVIYASYKFTCCAYHKHNSLSRLIKCTSSAPIHFPNQSGVFGHRAILIGGRGGSRHGWGAFSKHSLIPSTPCLVNNNSPCCHKQRKKLRPSVKTVHKRSTIERSFNMWCHTRFSNVT